MQFRLWKKSRVVVVKNEITIFHIYVFCRSDDLPSMIGCNFSYVQMTVT